MGLAGQSSTSKLCSSEEQFKDLQDLWSSRMYVLPLLFTHRAGVQGQSTNLEKAGGVDSCKTVNLTNPNSGFQRMTLPVSGLTWTHQKRAGPRWTTPKFPQASTAPKNPGPCHSPSVSHFCSIVHESYILTGKQCQAGLYTCTPVTRSAIKHSQSILIPIVLLVLC